MAARTIPLLLAAAVPAQSIPLPPGHGAARVHLETASPWGLRGFAIGVTLDDRYVAVDHLLLRFDSRGAFTLVRDFGFGNALGLIARPPGTALLYYSDLGASRLYRRDLATGSETSGPLPANAYDLLVDARGRVLVSANPRYPQPGAQNGVWLVDPAGAHREVIALTGPSGPIELAANGDLLYATQSWTFPTPAGSVDLLRFAASKLDAAIAAGAPLTAADATVEVAGLDGAGDLAFDDRGRLYWSDPQHGTVGRTAPDGRTPEPAPFVTGVASALGMQRFDGGAATFDPWQPGGDDALFLATSDWVTKAEVWRIHGARPGLRSSAAPSVPAGPLSLRATGLPANAPAVLWLNLLPPVPERIVVTLGGVPVWSALDFAAPPFSAAGVSDGAGNAVFAFTYPGGWDTPSTWQAGALGAGGVVTSEAVALRLLR